MEPSSYVTCSHGFNHPVCAVCLQPRPLYQSLLPPLGGRDSRVPVYTCQECHDGVIDRMDTVEKLRALLGYDEAKGTPS